MTRSNLAVLTLALTMGAAAAQVPTTMADRAKAAHAVSGREGTVGAMQGVVQGIATSADDVAAQQEGRSTAADGGNLLDDRPASAAAGSAPGTVGAAPGSDMPR